MVFCVLASLALSQPTPQKSEVDLFIEAATKQLEIWRSSSQRLSDNFESQGYVSEAKYMSGHADAHENAKQILLDVRAAMKSTVLREQNTITQ